MGAPDWFRKDFKSNEIDSFRSSNASMKECFEQVSNMLQLGGNETSIQSILKKYPEFVGSCHKSGHARWAFSEKVLPPEYRADWILASENSAGLQWVLIELEDPQHLPFKKNGHYSECTRKGIEQIKDWRDYIQHNLDYMVKPISQHGLGLHNIRPMSPGIIVVGRNTLYGSDPA